MTIIDSELCLDDYVKMRKIKLSLKEERMAKKKCQVLYEHYCRQLFSLNLHALSRKRLHRGAFHIVLKYSF